MQELVGIDSSGVDAYLSEQISTPYGWTSARIGEHPLLRVGINPLRVDAHLPAFMSFAKNIMFWPKMVIFSGPKIFKSGSAVRPHRGLSSEVSHDPIPLRMSMGIQIL